MPDPLFLAAIIGLPAIALLVLLLGFISYRGMIHFRIRDEAFIRDALIALGELDEADLRLPWIEDEIVSPSGYSLSLHALEGGRGKIALFHHGVGSGWMTMIRYMKLFRARGWTVVTFDSRGHGDSGGGRPSYGYYEKADLKAVADWSFASFGAASSEKPRFVAFGESMGAATVLQYAPLDPRLDAVIADCPYSSAMAELDYRLKAAMVPPGLRRLAVLAADAFCRRLERFSLRDADPSRAILETGMPILFVHGLEDRYVPWRMSVVMAETRRRRLPRAVTELLLVPGAKHCGSLAADRERYAEALYEFLENASVKA
jgi:uncharacterized protein